MTQTLKRSASTRSVDERLAQVRGFLIDMDGTLYVGHSAMPGAVELMATLRRRGCPCIVLTNNSSRDGDLYVERLASLGIKVARPQVLTSSDASAAWLALNTEIRRPYVLGTQALRTACRANGLIPTAFEGDPDAVLLGYDIELTYRRLSEACLLVAQHLPYYATHADRTCIDARGLLPDAGALIAAVETTTQRQPIVLGKPNRAMLDAALERLALRADEVLIIGDQLDTDITMGRQLDVLCALVLSGETDAEQAAASVIQPDLVVPHVGALLERLLQLWGAPDTAWS